MDDDRTALGARIRSIRKSHRVTVRALAETAQLSPAFISQIENGKSNASFDALRKIALALGVTFSDLFDSSYSTTSRVLRRDERPQLAVGDGICNYSITRPPSGEVDVTVSEYQPGASSGSEDYTHGDSREVVMVLKGSLSFFLGGETHTLQAGDSLDFRTSVPHMIKNLSDEMAEAIWIISPPSGS